MSVADHAWELPGSITARRIAIYGTAAKVAARYGARRPPWVRHGPVEDVHKPAMRRSILTSWNRTG